MANALQLIGGSVLKDLKSHTKEIKENSMKDKVQKTKEWISKTQDGLMDAQGDFEYPEHEGAYNILCNLDAYIDSMQEEPVSEDLEMAAEQDVCEVVNCCSATGIPNDHIPSWVQDAMVNEFIHGAKWQKERFEKDCADLCNGIATAKGLAVTMAYDKGMADAREQMMKNAVDGVVHHFEKCGVASVHYNDPTGVPMAYFTSPEGLSAGDKVKIIVIKEAKI